MPFSVRNSTAPGPGWIRDFRHRLLGASHHVFDVRVGLAREPTPRVRTVDPAQLVDDPIFYRLRVPVFVRVVGRAASLRRDGQAAPRRLRMQRTDRRDAVDGVDADNDEDGADETERGGAEAMCAHARS